MTDLVDYLRDKLAIAQRGCTCPTPGLLSNFPVGVLVLADCVEHGQTRQTVGGFAWARTKS